MSEQETSRRRTQPRCHRVMEGGKRCNHALSFHGTEGGPCKALGCHCEGFVPGDDSLPIESPQAV